MYKTEQECKKACDEAYRQAKEGIIPSYSVSDAMWCITIEMWKSDWWKQKSTNV